MIPIGRRECHQPKGRSVLRILLTAKNSAERKYYQRTRRITTRRPIAISHPPAVGPAGRDGYGFQSLGTRRVIVVLLDFAMPVPAAATSRTRTFSDVRLASMARPRALISI